MLTWLRKVEGLQFLRLLLAASFVLVVCSVLELKHGVPSFVFAAVVGVLTGRFFAKKIGSIYTLILTHVLFFILTLFLYYFLESVFVSIGSPLFGDLWLYKHSLRATFACLSYGWWCFFTYYYWKSRKSVTIEVLLLVVCILVLFSAHRDYNPEGLSFIADLAWGYHIPTSLAILGFGVLLSVVAAFLLYVSQGRELIGEEGVEEVRSLKSGLLDGLVGLSLLLLVVLYAKSINSWYERDIALGASGVGQDNDEGSSPLGFHSDIGKSKTAAALVRFEEDFTDNPWNPMVYFREQALSGFSGREMVSAPILFDEDVPRIRPGYKYQVDEEFDFRKRKSVIHSVYVLTKHQNVFALDYPLTITPNKNPDPERFLQVYTASSLAPTVPLSKLESEDVGEAGWNKRVWDHYLRAPGSKAKAEFEHLADLIKVDPVYDDYGEDLRYRMLAEKLVKKEPNPVVRARKIIEYLSKASIYTRSPGHKVSSDADPVAPYLFSEDMRGYCVHFAHAATYLMRLSGIPARIATGYLVDSSYGRDGHLLLHLGDRHAWPEIYISGYGWIVADISPERAEGEEELIPDAGLLEDLMSKIDPTEPLVPDWESSTEEDSDSVLNKANVDAFLKFVTWSALLFVLTIALLKVYFRYSFFLVSNSEKRNLYCYRSYYTSALNLGFGRKVGETRVEFAERVNSEVGLDGRILSSCVNKSKYSSIKSLDEERAKQGEEIYLNSLSKVPVWPNRVLGMFSLGYLSWLWKW